MDDYAFFKLSNIKVSSIKLAFIRLSFLKLAFIKLAYIKLLLGPLNWCTLFGSAIILYLQGFLC